MEKTEKEDKRFSRQIIGKTVVSKSGKKFGEVADIIFEPKTGELINVVLTNPTPYVEKLELERDKDTIHRSGCNRGFPCCF